MSPNGEERIAQMESRIDQIENVIRAVDQVLEAAATTELVGKRVRRGLRLSRLLVLAGAGAAVGLALYGKTFVTEQMMGAEQSADGSQADAAA